MNEARVTCPLWIELSGLPAHLNTCVRKDSWGVFKKVAELDCESHSAPDVVKISLRNLAERTGLSSDVVEKCLAALEKKQYIHCFLPDNEEEEAFIRIACPLNTPAVPAEMKKARPDLFPPGRDFFRYADIRPVEKEDDPILSEIVDLYLNTIGLKMNVFILDEIRMMRERFTISDIKRAFEKVKQQDNKSLRSVLRHLFFGNRINARKKTTKKRKRL